MGSSCVSNRKSMSSRKSRDFSEYPDDLNSYNQARRSSLQKHKFQGVLYNIAIINYPKSGVSLKFSIDEIVEVMLPKKFKTKDSQDIKWVIKEKFTFLADQYELRLKFLTVKLTDEQGKIKQILKINLFKIATGPYHNDFQIKGDTRIKFDFKVSQYVELKINCKQTKAELNKKQYPGESFHFTIRVLKEENQQPFESNPSYIQTSPYLKSQKIDKVSSQYDQCPSPIKIRNKVPVKSFQPKCSFTWSSDNGQMPNFRILVKSNKIENTVLHLVIWRAENQIETQDTNQADQNADMFCEAFTHFTQILQKEAISKKASNTNQYIQQRVLFLQKQGLWSDGQKIGQYSIKMVVENNTFIKQMKACTRTQQGIIESTPLFSATVGAQSKQHKVAKFAQIQQMMQKIQSLNKQINQNKKLSYLSSQKLKQEMIGEFQKIRKFFQSDLQNSFYVPTTQQQGLKLIDEQKLLMSVLSRVISYAQDDDTLTEVCWRVANVIARRGQFQLCNIGFNKNDQAEMKKSISPFYQKKLKTALDFQELQYKLLLQSLRIGYIEGRQDPRQAVEMFRAYAYFRVPCYREIILRKVVRKQDLSIQWNTSITDEQIESMPEAQTILSSQLDWQNNFYKPLQVESKSEVLTKQMIQNLEGSLWLQQISKRGSTFFYFLYFLISKLSELGKRIKFIKWQYFPGYNKLVRAFLFQMRNIKVDRYPQSMIQTSIYLLANEKLLNIFVSMIFEKTNVHDHNGLMKGLDIISRYLNHFTKNNKMLPPSFNYVYFFKGIKAILQGQFAYAMVKILSIIFMNFDNFNVEFKKSLSFYLLGRVFFKLFLNWSFTTRKAFYHVLILKIQRTNIFDAESRKQFSNKHQIMNSISTRYQESMKIVKNAYQVSKSENHNRFLRNQNKQLFKHLKKKIALKRKKADNKYSANNNDLENVMIKRSSNPIDYKNSIDSPVKLQNKYSLRELTKTSSTQRSFSVMLDPNIINFALQNYKKNEKNVEEKAQTRTRSGTAYIDTGDEQGQMSGTKPKKIKQRRRSIYGMDEFEMRQMDKKQIRYLQTSLKQFQDLDQAIRKYYMTYNQLPICELDVEVPIDEKQIKPSSADFEQWQATQNSQLDMN